MDTEMIMKEALQALRDGKVILYPTDTVWGIGCDATNPAAVARVYEIKRRSDAKSLVLLAADLDMVARYVRAVPSIAVDLVEVNDAPMTIIYPEGLTGPKPDQPAPADKLPPADRYRLAFNTVASDGSVGIRVPLTEFCRELCRKLGRPIVSTSANISGEPTPGSFEEIAPEIVSAVDLVIDRSLEKQSTGRASQIIKVGLDSTVEIIRP
ncbi:MAG: Sua5/YciO/YrdC/YwlC family protein [Bacteroidales bacterium]|nr:Sua5/YciO/YrdC/YwlC family protein [Bacteroidales bacterium]